MANAFMLAHQQKELLQPFRTDTIPSKLLSQKELRKIKKLPTKKLNFSRRDHTN